MSTFLDKSYLDYQDVLLLPQKAVVNSREEVELFRRIKTKYSKVPISCIPIIVANLDTSGTIAIAKATEEVGFLTALHKYHTLEDLQEASFGYAHFMSFGMSESIEEIDKKINVKSNDFSLNHYIMIDVANGYTDAFCQRISEIRKAFPNRVIAAGNIATPDMIKFLDNAGVDIIKIGIGPGNLCRTRSVTGVGVPQFTAVLECAEEAREHSLHVIADGGINELADFGKALAIADFVMAGTLFTGFKESGGEIMSGKNYELYKEAYGMASSKAMETYGQQKEYRSSEGRVIRVPYKGDITPFIEEILGALRSTVSYCGCNSLTQLKERANFIRVNNTINRNSEQLTIGI